MGGSMPGAISAKHIHWKYVLGVLEILVSPWPQEASDAKLDGLRAAGVTEEEILETVQIVAIFNATNRLNAGLGVRVDGGAFDAFRA